MNSKNNYFIFLIFLLFKISKSSSNISEYYYLNISDIKEYYSGKLDSSKKYITFTDFELLKIQLLNIQQFQSNYGNSDNNIYIIINEKYLKEISSNKNYNTDYNIYISNIKYNKLMIKVICKGTCDLTYHLYPYINVNWIYLILCSAIFIICLILYIINYRNKRNYNMGLHFNFKLYIREMLFMTFVTCFFCNISLVLENLLKNNYKLVFKTELCLILVVSLMMCFHAYSLSHLIYYCFGNYIVIELERFCEIGKINNICLVLFILFDFFYFVQIKSNPIFINKHFIYSIFLFLRAFYIFLNTVINLRPITNKIIKYHYIFDKNNKENFFELQCKCLKFKKNMLILLNKMIIIYCIIIILFSLINFIFNKEEFLILCLEFILMTIFEEILSLKCKSKDLPVFYNVTLDEYNKTINDFIKNRKSHTILIKRKFFSEKEKYFNEEISQKDIKEIMDNKYCYVVMPYIDQQNKKSFSNYYTYLKIGEIEKNEINKNNEYNTLDKNLENYLERKVEIN